MEKTDTSPIGTKHQNLVQKELVSSWKRWLSATVSLFLLLLSYSTFAQSKKFDKALSKAENALAQEDYHTAEKWLGKCLSIDSNQVVVYDALAQISYKRNDSVAVIFYYDKALEINPAPVISDYSKILWNNKSYKKLESILRGLSKKTFASLSRSTKKRLHKYQRDLDFRKNYEAVTDHTNLVPLDTAINTPLNEYAPSFSIQQDYILFTRLIEGQEDFFISDRKDTAWQTARPLDELNTRYNEGAHCISADGKTIIFTACDYVEGLGSCDLYISRWNGEQWSRPKNMEFPINSRNWESQPFLAPDNRTLYFSSNRPGGQGGKDIWKTVYQGKDGWSRPEPLPDWINTPGDEEAPFIYYDNNHLFFASDAHPGFGGKDIFYATGNGENWMVPVNAGPSVNSAFSEQSLYITSAGETALMSRDFEGNRDIYQLSIQLPTPLPKSHYSIIQVKDALDSSAVNAAIVQIVSPTTERKIRTDRNGSKLIILPGGDDYKVFIEKDGYTFSSAPYHLDSGSIDLPDTSIFYIFPIDAKPTETIGKEIVLNTVEFATASAELLESSSIELKKLHAFLIDNPTHRIQIEGHTDSVGSDVNNLALSEKRAKTVADFLIDLGVGMDRIRYVGKGESEPIATNDTEEGRQANRRTSFRIITP